MRVFVQMTNMNKVPGPSPSRRIAQQKILRRLAKIDFVLPGSVSEVMSRCGKPNCRCNADPPQLHGPYYQWTRKVAGRTVTRKLTKDQAQRFKAWFDNSRKLRELIARLEALSIQILEEERSRNR